MKFPKGEIYQRFIEENFEIVDKRGASVPFILNAPQLEYLERGDGEADIILKFRQPGFSSLIDAIFTTDFLLKKNSFSVVVADIEDNAVGLLDRIKYFLKSYEYKHKIKIPLKYNSRFELYNNLQNSRLLIGTAKNTDFGRSKTITNLHFSELAYFSDIGRLIAGCAQAVVEGGRKIFETTANGFNEFQGFWTRSKNGETGYNALFFGAQSFYSAEFLAKKKMELGEKFAQEYPENDIECFLSSGQTYFSRDAVRDLLMAAQGRQNGGAMRGYNVVPSIS